MTFQGQRYLTSSPIPRSSIPGETSLLHMTWPTFESSGFDSLYALLQFRRGRRKAGLDSSFILARFMFSKREFGKKQTLFCCPCPHRPCRTSSQGPAGSGHPKIKLSFLQQRSRRPGDAIGGAKQRRTGCCEAGGKWTRDLVAARFTCSLLPMHKSSTAESRMTVFGNEKVRFFQYRHDRRKNVSFRHRAWRERAMLYTHMPVCRLSYFCHDKAIS